MQDLIGAGLAITVGLVVLVARPLGLWIEEFSYDFSYWLRPSIPISDVAVVSMDANSQKELNLVDANGWDRRLHANLLDRLIARGAKAVIFTTVFSKPSDTNSADRLFAQALRRARGKVVLAASVVDGAVQTPIPELAAVAPWGLLVVPNGTDAVVRRHGVPEGHPTLASRASQLLGKPSSNALAARWLNYYAPQIELPEISYKQVLDGTESPGALKGKIVFISPPSAGSELLPTPYTRWTGRLATPATIEATALLNLYRHEWLSRLSPTAETSVLVVTGAVFGLAFMGMRWSASILLAFGAMTLITVGACVLATYLHFWFPWIVVAGVQIPVALGWSGLCGTIDRAQVPQIKFNSSMSNLSPTSPPATSTSPVIQTDVPSAVATDAPNIPDHSLIKCIGRGAYGEVWLARDVIGRHDAVKIIKARNFPHATPYEREFKGIERFAPISRTHPGLMQVLHVGRHDAAGYFFYIMELADDASGTTTPDPERYVPKTLASELAQRGHFPVRESVQIGLTLSSALQHLHEHNLVHRDIKPSNIIFVGGKTKIADIGLVAELGTGAEQMTRLGTEGYLPPEGPGASTADVYALGKVLYELSMGRDRWQFPEFPTTLGTRPDQDDLQKLHAIILTACETEPAHRYPTAAAMHTALTALLEQA